LPGKPHPIPGWRLAWAVVQNNRSGLRVGQPATGCSSVSAPPPITPDGWWHPAPAWPGLPRRLASIARRGLGLPGPPVGRCAPRPQLRSPAPYSAGSFRAGAGLQQHWGALLPPEPGPQRACFKRKMGRRLGTTGIRHRPNRPMRCQPAAEALGV